MLPHHRGLTRATVVEAAAGLADREGLATVTARRLAADLDVTPMALYRHVRDMDDLRYAMADHVLALVTLPSSGGGTRETLEQTARALRRAFLAHPWAAGLVSGGVFVSPSSLALAEIVHGALAAAGVPPAGRVRLYAAYARAVLSLVLFETGAGAPQPAGERRDALRSLAGALAELPPATYPNLVAAAPHVTGLLSDDAAFEDALALLIDAFERAVARAVADDSDH